LRTAAKGGRRLAQTDDRGEAAEQGSAQDPERRAARPLIAEPLDELIEPRAIHSVASPPMTDISFCM